MISLIWSCWGNAPQWVGFLACREWVSALAGTSWALRTLLRRNARLWMFEPPPTRLAVHGPATIQVVAGLFVLRNLSSAARVCFPHNLDKGEIMAMQGEPTIGRWGALRGAIRMEWDDIPDEDLERIENDRERLIECLRHRYGYTRMQASAEIERFIRDQGLNL